MGQPAARAGGHARLPDGHGTGPARRRPDLAPGLPHRAHRQHARRPTVGDMATCVGPPDTIVWARSRP